MSLSGVFVDGCFGWKDNINSVEGSLNSINAENGTRIKKGRPSNDN